MRVYHDQDADMNLLAGRRIGVIGYGNQGRAQALNLRDSGLEVIVGNQEDEYAQQARADGFTVLPLAQAAAQADILLLLIPDEVMPQVFEQEIAPHLSGKVLAFASGYNVAFGFITPPPDVDVVLVAPRMIGAGVRDLYLAGCGFPSFIGVAQDVSGRAKEIALALARGIGSTRAGVVEVTFAQEAELDLFTEQCFGPAFGHVLTTAVDLLLEEGYPPEAVLLELYMSGELSYTLGKIAELGMVEQGALHSRTSQYGSMSRGMRFLLPELRARMRQGLEEIRSGQFAREWAAEQAAGCPTLAALKEAARSLPLYELERELRQALGSVPTYRPAPAARGASLPAVSTGRRWAWLRRLWPRRSRAPDSAALGAAQMETVLRRFLARAAGDPALRAFSRGRQLTTHYVLKDVGLEFTMRFQDGSVAAGLGPPDGPAEVRLETTGEVLDGMFTGRINALRAAMSGQLSFSGEARLAMSVQQVQDDLCRLYRAAREETLA
ncbi:MAG: ketol-acid reductoisomerase [Anaerolineae bacterium]|nr:ketol-acid reductoisomerase [Anaerolineae bacterium]